MTYVLRYRADYRFDLPPACYEYRTSKESVCWSLTKPLTETALSTVNTFNRATFLSCNTVVISFWIEPHVSRFEFGVSSENARTLSNRKTLYYLSYSIPFLCSSLRNSGWFKPTFHSVFQTSCVTCCHTISESWWSHSYKQKGSLPRKTNYTRWRKINIFACIEPRNWIYTGARVPISEEDRMALSLFHTRLQKMALKPELWTSRILQLI